MSQTFEFYDKQAKAAEAEAEGAQLDNVRERELRSARAWREMADRQLMIDAERVKAEAFRTARRAAELEEAEAASARRAAERDEMEILLQPGAAAH